MARFQPIVRNIRHVDAAEQSRDAGLRNVVGAVHAKQGVRAEDRDDTAKVFHHVESAERQEAAERRFGEKVGNREDRRGIELAERTVEEFETLDALQFVLAHADEKMLAAGDLLGSLIERVVSKRTPSHRACAT